MNLENIRKQQDRKTIGLLIGDISGAYNNAIWQGALTAVNERKQCFICFSGGNIIYTNEKEFGDRKNLVYNLINTQLLDGIIFTSTTLANFITAGEYNNFINSYLKIPAVSIGRVSLDIPQCIIENDKSMLNSIDHLINVHGRKKIAYISGPDGSDDARIRLEAYKAALAKNNLPFNAQYVYTGDFLRPSGEKAATVFLKERKIQIDGLAAANDDMAIGAIYTLQKSGYIIPRDISVAGFDDIDEAITVNPPLSTVRQPVFEQAYEAACMLMDIIEKKPVKRTQIISAVNITRQSCGCFARKKAGQQNSSIHPALANPSTLENLKNNTLNRIEGRLHKKQWQENQQSIHLLVGSLYNQLSGQTADFLEVFYNILDSVLTSEGDMALWQEIVSILMEETCNREEICIPDELCQEALTLFYEMVLRYKSKLNTKNNNETNLLHSIMQKINANFEFASLKRIILENFKHLQIPSCYISIYEKRAGKYENSNLLYAYGMDGEIIFPDSMHKFPTNELIPDRKNQFRNSAYIVAPLFFNKEDIGFIVMETKGMLGSIYESLAPQLSSALKGAALLEMSRMTENNLKVRNRKIESLIKPMLELIKQVTAISMDKMQSIQKLSELSRNSYTKISKTNSIIDQVAANFNKIKNIINIIDDISVTVNLVSINASIEAAHAGQYGKGFAVIAREIKKLSDSTKKNAEEIAKTLKDVIEAVKNTLASSNESIKTFQEQEKEVNEILKSLKLISANMEDLSRKSNEILTAMDY